MLWYFRTIIVCQKLAQAPYTITTSDLSFPWTILCTTPLIPRSAVNKLMPCYAWLLSGALEITRVVLRSDEARPRTPYVTGLIGGSRDGNTGHGSPSSFAVDFCPPPTKK